MTALPNGPLQWYHRTAPGIVAGPVLRIVLVYALLSCLWILGSDKLVGVLFSDPGTIIAVSVVKGWIFVALTSLLLYLMIGRMRAALMDQQSHLVALQADKMRALNLLDAVVNGSPDAILVKDGQGRYRLVNDAAARMIGKDAAEVIGQDDRALWPLPHARAMMEDDQALMAGGKMTILEEEIETGAGKRDFLTAKGPLRDEAGRLDGLFIISRDITDQKRIERQAIAEGSFLRTLIRTIPDLVWLKDPDGAYLACNAAFERFFGVDQGWLMGKTDFDFTDPLLAQFFRDKDLAAVAAGGPSANEEWLTAADSGAHCLFETVKTPMLDPYGKLIGVLGIAREITLARRAQEALRESEAMLRQSQRVASVGHYVLDIVGGQWTSSEALDAVFGIDESFRKDVEGWLTLIHPEERDMMAAYLQEQVLNGRKGFDREYRILRHSDGAERWLHGLGQIESGPDGQLTRMFGTIQDITERKLAEQRIEFLAQHDALTGLPNRVLFHDRLQQAVARAERNRGKTALLFIDLDNFKAVNDSLGHAVGDELLKGIALRLTAGVRDTDTVSRQGGDEFLIVLSDLPDLAAATPVLTNLIDLAQAPFIIDGQEVSTSFSVGVALYPDDGRDFETLRKKADMAMYRAKEAGRNTYRYFDTHMSEEDVGKLRMRNDLRRALERKEFSLHFQPQFDLDSGKVKGAEALLRWAHPELGAISPALFIPVAEASGMINPLGDWVLTEACRQMAEWQKGGLGALTVAVNLSATQFQAGNVHQSVEAALAASGLKPQFLELELTESLLIRDPETVLAVVRGLKTLGVQFSIDDFGTGYSSLAYLKRFAVDKLKIDQSFVRDLPDDADDAAIVGAIIQMARSLNLKTVAEGIETVEILDHLRRLRCDEGQGYLFARPLPPADFERFLEKAGSVHV